MNGEMAKTLREALIIKYEGEIAEAKANIKVYLMNPVGIGEHSDVTDAIQCELDKIARYDDQIEVIKKYVK